MAWYGDFEEISGTWGPAAAGGGIVGQMDAMALCIHPNPEPFSHVRVVGKVEYSPGAGGVEMRVFCNASDDGGQFFYGAVYTGSLQQKGRVSVGTDSGELKAVEIDEIPNGSELTVTVCFHDGKLTINYAGGVVSSSVDDNGQRKAGFGVYQAGRVEFTEFDYNIHQHSPDYENCPACVPDIVRCDPCLDPVPTRFLMEVEGVVNRGGAFTCSECPIYNDGYILEPDPFSAECVWSIIVPNPATDEFCFAPGSLKAEFILTKFEYDPGMYQITAYAQLAALTTQGGGIGTWTDIIYDGPEEKISCVWDRLPLRNPGQQVTMCDDRVNTTSTAYITTLP